MVSLSTYRTVGAVRIDYIIYWTTHEKKYALVIKTSFIKSLLLLPIVTRKFNEIQHQTKSQNLDFNRARQLDIHLPLGNLWETITTWYTQKCGALSKGCADLRIEQATGDLPSGKRTKNYGKSPFWMGKSTISMAIFNSYVTNYQRVVFFHPNGWFIGKRVPLALPKIGIQASKIGI